MRNIHPLTAENMHIFTEEQQKKIKEMKPDRNTFRFKSQRNGKRVGIIAEFCVTSPG